MKKLLFISGIFLMVAAQAWCYPENYGPFEPGQQPKGCPLPECLCLTSIPGEDNAMYVYIKDINSKIYVVVLKNDCEYFVKIEDSSGRAILPKIRIDGATLFCAQVYWGFLNEDDRPDYVVETLTGGCGLMAGVSYQTYLISDGESFQPVVMTTFSSSDNCVDLNNDGHSEIIHTDFVLGENGKDGKTHNYWVHNLLQFKGTNVVSANHLDSRFPCWIWCTYKPNHKNTIQLTGEQKRRLWKEHTSVPNPNFPDASKLADEQGK